MTQKNWTWEDFDKWDAKNPHVYGEIVLACYEVQARGKSKTSMWLICGKLRWESQFSTTGSVFKLPNESFAFYSRKVMHEYAHFAGFFNTKPLKCGERPSWQWPTSRAA
jgi:hypothetical protein